MKLKRSTILITATAITAALLVGCGTSSTPTQEKNTAVSIEAYEVRIEYYEDLIKDLQASLLQAKEESFIAASTYRAEIDELYQSIKELKKQKDTTPTNAGNQFNSNSHFNSNNNDNGAFTAITATKPFSYDAKNGEITITKYINNEETVIIPTHIDGFPVANIGEHAFSGTKVKRVILPDTLRKIDWFAFSDCANLAEVSIPSSVTSIGHDAFRGCPSSLHIICEKGSYAEAYAHSWGIAAKIN